MTYPLYAVTVHDGPVLIGEYPSAQARRRAESRENEAFDSLGMDEVTGFTYEVSEAPVPARPETNWPSATVQLALL
jgi:hypothetical protein